MRESGCHARSEYDVNKEERERRREEGGTCEQVAFRNLPRQERRKSGMQLIISIWRPDGRSRDAPRLRLAGALLSLHTHPPTLQRATTATGCKPRKGNLPCPLQSSRCRRDINGEALAGGSTASLAAEFLFASCAGQPMPPWSAWVFG